MIGGNTAFGMGDGELTNQHPAQEILWEILREMLWEMLQDRVEGTAYLGKAVIGGNLAFRTG